MISLKLHDFIERVSAAGCLSAGDVEHLRADILSAGIASRIEAEALLTLDRSVEGDDGWSAALASIIVEFVVWSRSPRGSVASEDALWLTTLLEMGGPSASAMAIAYGILDEAHHVDGTLLDFIMRGRQQARLMSVAA
ncbi:hypothetical protein [Microvirga pudoricolor]|uniref:hypothetical protein n=1 Tax=Microvirga pudoricolor TaxID=2778729 RepID=UPI00195057C9|nr:hypothetical protein [Microvirga pudoricolor]MBM6596078.1 hypothetical protein [Microvirga pudoricolor]